VNLLALLDAAADVRDAAIVVFDLFAQDFRVRSSHGDQRISARFLFPTRSTRLGHESIIVFVRIL
jgi:hypothetical protein